MDSASHPWICFHKPRPAARLRLFCFPYAGGGASVYRDWSASLPEHIDVCPVQLPGRENRIAESAFVRIGPLVEVLSRVLCDWLDRPFALFGHSMGTIIAYEVAQRLRTEFCTGPVHLFVSSRGAPHLPAEEAPSYALPEAGFKAKLRQYNGTPEQVLNHPELMGLMLPLLRRDFELNDTYAPSSNAPLDCPITAFGGLDDATVRRPRLEAWRETTRGRFDLRMFPGDHFYIHRHAPQLIEAMAEALEPLA